MDLKIRGPEVRRALPRRSEGLTPHDLEDERISAGPRLRGLDRHPLLRQLPGQGPAVAEHTDRDDLGGVEAVPEVPPGIRAAGQALDLDLLARPA